MKGGALSCIGAPALVASLGELAGPSLIAWLLGDGLELDKGGVEVRQGRQARDKGENNLERGRVKLTGTPMLGLPPVPSGDAAFFWYAVYSGLARITLHVAPSWVYIIPMKPTVEGSGPGRREQRYVGVGVVG